MPSRSSRGSTIDFWKQTWPTLKANGWSVDARDGAFYPPQAQKMHAAKRRRLGSEHKNCFKNIHELTIYLSSDPVLYVGESESASGRESAGKGKFTKSRGKFAQQINVNMTKTCATRRTESAWRKTKMHRQRTISRHRRVKRKRSWPISFPGHHPLSQHPQLWHPP